MALSVITFFLAETYSTPGSHLMWARNGDVFEPSRLCSRAATASATSPLALVPLARQLLELARKSAGLPLAELQASLMLLASDALSKFDGSTAPPSPVPTQQQPPPAQQPSVEAHPPPAPPPAAQAPETAPPVVPSQPAAATVTPFAEP
jgi:hypothetical protein